MIRDPDDGDSITVRIAAELGAQIRDGVLPPGAPLPSGRVLADRFGVSRATVRDALGRLEARGLITLSPRRGAFVARADREQESRDVPALRPLPVAVELDDLFDVRRLLEPAAAGWAARRADADALARLRRLAETFAAAVADDAPERATAADIAFHVEIAACAGNPLLERLAEQLYDARRLRGDLRIRRRSRGEQAAAEHERILRALIARDSDAAARAMVTHLAAAEAAARSAQADEPGID